MASCVFVPESNLNLRDIGRSTGSSMDNFVRGVGVRLTYVKNFMIKKLKWDEKSVETTSEK